MALDIVKAAFMPLIDASILVAAREMKFADAEGLDLVLTRETSWANVRDRIAIGHFDVAHMLAPMPIAANLGLTPMRCELIAPMALGLGGNAVTVSKALSLDASQILDAASAGTHLRGHIVARLKAGEPKLQFAVVHSHSAHNLELRYWLAACGIDPEKDIDIVILPPSYMVDALQHGTIDGYCVGEPWNSMAVERDLGSPLTTKNAIWAASPEKVLGVRTSWASEKPDILAALLRALIRSAKWCGNSANRGALSQMLARPDYLNVPAAVIERSLGSVAGFEPFEKAATFPWLSHAMWFYSQMVRWSLVAHVPGHVDLVQKTYRPDLYRRALTSTGTVIPSANSKVEGALKAPMPVGTTGGVLILGPDGFFDGLAFDPDEIDAYILAQKKA